MIIKRNKQKQPKIQPKPQVVDDLPISISPQEEVEVSEVVEVSSSEVPQTQVIEEENNTDIFAGFDFSEIDFSQRAERRRGDRRRGYRRVDDRNLISRAQHEAILIKEQSSKEGFEQGLKSAQETIASLKSSIEEFFVYKDELYKQLSGDILDISIKVAEKIIKKEVESSKEVLNSIIQDAFKSIAKDENKIILKVNPTDVEYTKEIIPQFLASGQVEAKIYVSGNKDVEEGSVIIETSNGVIDANISTQIEIIKEAFKQI